MTDEPKPKLIIDEDWKTQVERERAAQKKPAEKAPASPPPESDPAAAPAPATEHTGPQKLPPASFPLLVQMLATQTLAALGLFHDPAEGEPHIEPEVAQHFIDLLGLLEAKTKGNLSAEEASLLGQTLHELRMLYVARR